MLSALTLISLLSSAQAEPPPATTPAAVELEIGGMLQPELDLFPSDGGSSQRHGSRFRRWRTNLSASWGAVSLELVPELAGSRVRGQDVFLDVTLHKDDRGSLVLRIGKDKPPISIDLLHTAAAVDARSQATRTRAGAGTRAGASADRHEPPSATCSSGSGPSRANTSSAAAPGRPG